MKIKKMIFVLAGMLFLLNGGPSFGDEILIVGNHYKPPKAFLKDDQPTGILVDIMRYIEQNTEYAFQIKLYPWKRSYKMAQDGEAGIIGLSMTTERLKIFDYSEVMYYDELLLVVIKGKEFPFDKLEDLKGKRVGVRRGSSYGDEFERGKKEIFQVDDDDNAVQRLKKLLAGRIDVALIGPGKVGMNTVIKKDPKLLQEKDQFVALAKPFKRDPNYLGFAKTMKMKTFLQKFNQVLEQGKQDGTIQTIIDKYAE